MLIKSLSVQVSGFLQHGNHAETPPSSPQQPSLLLCSTTVRDHLWFPVSPPPSLPPFIPLLPKWLGLPTVSGASCFLKIPQQTRAPARGRVLCWKMRYKIYLRFLVFVKIESSHFNCSRLGVLLQATGNGGPACRPLVLCGLLCSIVQDGDYVWLYPCHLSYLGSFR